LVLAWAIVESEIRDSWRYFVMHLLAALPILSEHPTTFMSDRDKGLMDAEALLPLCICHAYCCFHRKENFTTNSLVLLQISFGKLLCINLIQLLQPISVIYHHNSRLLHLFLDAAMDKILLTSWNASTLTSRPYVNFQLLNYYKRSGIKL